MTSSITSISSDQPSGPDTLGSYRFAILVASSLVASGIFHASIFAIQGASWEGPLSLRKPILFGISTGLTVFSITWVMTQLKPQIFDRWIANSFAFALWVEVGLITFQYWRGVASHFNHATDFDAAIEMTMLGLILFATVQLFYLTIRTLWFRDIDPAMAIAIRGGMWLLLLSCGLGIATSVLGEINISAGLSPEYWGIAGVLKFPHGAALHAIQLLPMIAWIARFAEATRREQILQFALVSQFLFLLYSVWQTGTGRNRFEFDAVGGCILGSALVCAFLAGLPIVKSLVRRLNRGP